MDLVGLLAKAKGLFSSQGKITDTVTQDRWDRALFDEIKGEVPKISDLVKELALHHDYAEDLVRDIATLFYQAAPEVTPQEQMDPRYLLNHAVTTDVGTAPETLQTKTFTTHDKYGAAMGVLSVVERIKDVLDRPPQDEAQEAGEQAQKAQEQCGMAMAGLEGAADGAQEAQDGLQGAAQALVETLGGYEGEGPLTEAQAGAQATLEGAEAEAEAAAQALAEALAAAEEAQDTADQATADAQHKADVARDNLNVPVREAIAAVGETLDADARLMAAWGMGPGELQSKSYAERQQLTEMLRRNRLGPWVDSMGRFRIAANASKMRKVEYGRDEFYDSELSGDLDRIFDNELAALCLEGDEGVEMLQMQAVLDFIEEAMPSRKYRGTEKIGKGALIVCVDTSGSMTDEDRNGIPREVWAKAFAMAMLEVASQSKRDFVGIIFSDAGEFQVFRFPRGKGTIEDRLAFCNLFYNGGTDFEGPLDEAMDILEADYNDSGKSKGDLIFITDDEYPGGVAAKWMERYQARKKRLDFRTFGIACGLSRPGSTLVAISDNVRTVTEFADPASVVDIMAVT